MYSLKLMNSVSENRIEKAIEMDHAAFQKSDWITKADAELIYRNKKNCLIWLTEEDTPAGFVTIFPLNERIAIQAVEKSKPIYKLLDEDAIHDPDTDILYCHCFLILPAYRGRGLVYQLYEGLNMWLEQNGAQYTSIYADAVSQDGRRCLERLGFAPIHSFGKEGMLYQADKNAVMQHCI